jgi:hypothetical protein
MITTETEERIVSIHNKMVGKPVWVLSENCIGKVQETEGTDGFKVLCRGELKSVSIFDVRST